MTTTKRRTGMKGTGQKPNAEQPGDDGRIELRLYVTDKTPRCLAAYDNLVRICEEHAEMQCKITVIDLLKNPSLARSEQITAIPTLVCETRGGRKKIVGTLADGKVVAAGLGLAAKAGWEPAPA